MTYSKKPLVGIIMGSSSDSRIMKGAAEILDEFKIKHEDQIVSAHRTPTRLADYAKHAEKNGFKVIAFWYYSTDLSYFLHCIYTLPKK